MTRLVYNSTYCFWLLFSDNVKNILKKIQKQYSIKHLLNSQFIYCPNYILNILINKS